MIKRLLRLGLADRPRAIEVTVRAEPAALPLGADPSVIYRAPQVKERTVFKKLGSIVCHPGDPVHLDTRERRSREPLARSLADYGRGLCRRIDPNHAVEIWAAFLEALAMLGPLPARSSSRWFERPWYGIDPLHFFERRLPSRHPDLAHGFDWAQHLGFDNLLLLSDPEQLQPIDTAIAHARERGVRLLGTLDLDRASDTHAVWLAGGDPASPELIRTAFARLARDVSSGLSGERFHHVDRWARAVDHPRGGAPSAHALVALFKLFLRLASEDQIVLADYAQSGGELLSLVGGDLPAGRDRASSTESDLVVWEGGVEALRRAVVDRDSRPLRDVLAAVPPVGHGSVLACALEQEGARRLAELLEGDRDRITLALACLYAMPAIPIVHAGIEIGARGVHLLEHWFVEARDSLAVSTLRALNRSVLPSTKRPKPEWIAVDDGSVIGWVLDEVMFVANLAAMPADVRLGDIAASLTPVGPMHRVTVSSPRAIRLGAHGFARFAMRAGA